MAEYTIDKIEYDSDIYVLQDNVSGYTTNTGTVRSVGVSNATDGGLSVSGSPITDSGTISIGHSNILTSAQTTQAVYPIKIDKNGHISAYGTAVTIPSIALNGSTTTSPSFYAPTSAGTSGYYLKSNGSGEPEWAAISTGGVTDVTVDGISVVTSGVAEIDSEVMIVTITYDENTGEYAADKTYTQIVNAISSGKYVVGKRHYVWDQEGGDESTEDHFLSQPGLIDDFGDVSVLFSEPIPFDPTKNGYTFYTISSIGGTDVVGTYDDYVTIPKQGVWYGTCNTIASTAQKSVTCSGFELTAGNIIGILFTTANTAATPTLNVNSTTAKSIYIGVSTPNATDNVLKWSANTMVYFQYDGSSFRYITSVSAGTVAPSRGANTWYGTSSTGATTQAKTSTIDNFVLTKGAVVYITFSTANTYSSAKITLNINSTGAKDVYYNNAVTSSTNTLPWNAGETLIFIYSGSYWYYVGKSVTKVSQLTNDSGYITSYTDENMKWTASTSSNTYYPLQSTSTATTSTANTLNGISFYQYYNTAGGYRRLDLGNSTAYTSTGGAYGTIRLYGAPATYYGDLVPGVLSTSASGRLTGNRTWTLPDATGTIALTSDIPTVPTITLNGSTTTSPSFYAPTSAGTDGYYLKSNGSGAPTWAAISAGGVTDVTVAGTSVVTSGVAAIAAPVQIVRW